MLIELGTDRLSRSKRAVQGTVAGLLGLAGTYGISPNIISAEHLSQVSAQERLITRPSEADIGIDSLTQTMSEQVTKVYSDLSALGLDDPVGSIITKAWVGDDGEVMIGYEKLTFTLGMDGKLKPYHMLQKLYDQDIDDDLRLGLLGGDPLPRKNYLITDSPRVLDTIASLAEYFQVPYYIPYSANFGPFNVYVVAIAQIPGNKVFALLEITEGPQAGKITLANIAPQLINTGLIPQDLVLDPSLIGTGGGTPEVQPTATPVPQPEPTPKPQPQPTPTTIIFPRYPQIPLPTPNPAITKRPEIKGDVECIRQTNSALDVLKDKLPVEYNFVLSHIGVIECAETEGGGGRVFSLETPPRAIIPRVFRGARIYYAGALTHESCHSWQYRRFREMYYPTIWPPPPGYISGLKAEEECENIGYQTQKKLGDLPENLKLFRDFVYQYYRGGVIIYDP